MTNPKLFKTQEELNEYLLKTISSLKKRIQYLEEEVLDKRMDDWK